MKRFALTTTLVAALVAISAVTASSAGAETALNCTFNAYTPYRATDGRIYAKLALRCSTDRYLYWHARLTKDRSLVPDLTAGASDGYDLFQAGVTYTWYLSNNRDSCPGSGNYFGKLSIQSGSLSTAYADRSSNAPISIC
jgi:hypothetical protein